MYTVTHHVIKSPALLREFCTTSMNADTSEESPLPLVACLVVSSRACHIEYLCSWDVWYRPVWSIIIHLNILRLVIRAMQDGLALFPGFSPAIWDLKAGKELGNKAKTGNQNYSHACIRYEEYAIYTNTLFLLLVWVLLWLTQWVHQL